MMRGVRRRRESGWGGFSASKLHPHAPV